MSWLEVPDGETILQMTWPSTEGGPSEVVFRLAEGQLWLLRSSSDDDQSELRGLPVADAPESTNDPLETLYLLYAEHPVLVHGEQALEATRQALKSHDALEVVGTAMKLAATPAACLALSRALEDEADPDLLHALAVRLLGMELQLLSASRERGDGDSPFTSAAGLPHIRSRNDTNEQEATGSQWRNAFTVELIERLCTWARDVTDPTLEVAFQPADPWKSGLATLRSGAAAGLRSADRERRIKALENLASATITPKGWARREEQAQARREAAEALADQARKARQQRQARGAPRGLPPWLPWVLGFVLLLVLYRMVIG